MGASQSFANRCQPRQVPTRPLRSGRCRSVLRIYAVALAEPVAPGVQTLVSKARVALAQVDLRLRVLELDEFLMQVTGEGDAQQTILDAVSGVKVRFVTIGGVHGVARILRFDCSGCAVYSFLGDVGPGSSMLAAFGLGSWVAAQFGSIGCPLLYTLLQHWHDAVRCELQ